MASGHRMRASSKGLPMNYEVVVTCAVTGAGDTLSKHPGVPVTPEQIADAVAFLARDESSFITGVALLNVAGDPDSTWAPWLNVHELGHQWWGDWVTCDDWRELWLNEGFATFLAGRKLSRIGIDSERSSISTVDDRVRCSVRSISKSSGDSSTGVPLPCRARALRIVRLRSSWNGSPYS